MAETVEHSKNFAKVQKYYKKGYWTLRMVGVAVGKWITAEEYEEITGQVYAA